MGSHGWTATLIDPLRLGNLGGFPALKLLQRAGEAEHVAPMSTRMLLLMALIGAAVVAILVVVAVTGSPPATTIPVPAQTQ
jgi:hypothetical protein